MNKNRIVPQISTPGGESASSLNIFPGRNTLRKASRVAVSILLLQICSSLCVQAQEAADTSGSTAPNAMTLSVRGRCAYSLDATTFTSLKRGQTLEQGTVVRTGDGAHTDLFFRRTGVTVRLQPDSEMKLEEMTVGLKDGLPIVHTLLDLRAGRIFTVVRSTVVGSTFEIKNAAGRAVLQGSGIGRYIITADGTHVAAEGSAIPIKLVRENGITIISAGQVFDSKEGKKLPLATTPWVKSLIDIDELEADTEGSAPTSAPPKP